MHPDFSGKRVSRYLLSSLIGSGSTGTVHRAVDTTMENSPAFAMKCIAKGRTTTRLRQQTVEIDNHSAIAGCPNILRLYDVFESDDHFFLVLSLRETDLFRAIWKQRVFWGNDERIRRAFIEILNGVSACHKQGIFHRDLKPENIMCNADGANVEIGDFGLSTNCRVCRDGRCGTNSYLSPECWEEDGFFYNAKPLDIWSLGVVLFNMVTSCYPWEEARTTDKEYMEFLSQQDHLLHHYPISEPLNELLCRIWHPAPIQRLSIRAIRQAVLEMDTFYRPSGIASPLSMKVFADSQQTCVATMQDEKKGTSGASFGIFKKHRCWTDSS